MNLTSSLSRYSVRAAIYALLRQDDASVRCTARRLGVSVRSLQRHLAEMGTSYGELVDEVRLETACRLLAESDERVSDIAMRLGYTGPSSFSRSFARLMKMSPTAYRQRQTALAKEW